MSWNVHKRFLTTDPRILDDSYITTATDGCSGDRTEGPIPQPVLNAGLSIHDGDKTVGFQWHIPKEMGAQREEAMKIFFGTLGAMIDSMEKLRDTVAAELKRCSISSLSVPRRKRPMPKAKKQ